MNFRLSDEQREMSETVRRFARTRGDAGARRAAFESETGHDAAFWRELMALGVGGVVLPERHGGLGLKLIDLALVAEALGYAAAPGPFLGHVLAGLAIDLCGDAPQKQRWLPALAAGEAIAAIAIAEAGDRCRPEASQIGVRNGALTGEKRDALFPELADVIVVATADGFALVEKGAAGMTFTPRDGADRTRRLSHIAFARTPADLMPTRAEAAIGDAALVLLAADAFGGASRCLDMAVEYAKTREQFGRPIGAFQGVKHQLANMAVDVEPARGLFWYAAYVFDAAPEERARMAAAAKAHIADVYMQAARLMIEIHGGVGYTWDHDAQIYFKRALFDFAYLGTPSRHRDRQAALAGWSARAHA